MTLSGVLALLQQHHWHKELSDTVAQLTSGRVLEVETTSNSSRLATLAALLHSSDRPVLIVTSRQDTAEELASSLEEYLEPQRTPMVWPTPETLAYEQLPVDRVASSRRVEILKRLADGDQVTVIAPAQGVTQQLSTPDDFARGRMTLRVGDRLRQDTLIATLLDQGYELTALALQPGQISRRGGIVDVFPPLGSNAVRVDFFGDEIDTLRLFDPSTQRSEQRVDSLEILPPLEVSLERRVSAAQELADTDTHDLRPEVAEEWDRFVRRVESGDITTGLDLIAPYLLPEPASLIDYLPQDHLLIVVEPASVQLSIGQLMTQAEELREALELAGELPRGLYRPYLTWDDLTPRLRQARQLVFGPLPSGWVPSVALPFSPDSGFGAETPNYAGRLDLLVQDVTDLVDRNWSIVVATEQSERTREVLEENDIFPRVQVGAGSGGPMARRDGQPLRAAPPAPGTVEVVHARIPGGWQHTDLQLLVLSDREIYGFRQAVPRRVQRRPAARPELLQSLEVGSYVVHIEHGIARYGGLTRLETSGVEREYLLLEYAETDRLYLPVDQIDRVTNYEGGGIDPKLTRLGSPEWAKVKSRVRKAVREMAFELLQLYAARESAQSVAMPPDTAWDHELEESFTFTETADQLRAINEVKTDLEQTRPMDRLVCGDVGYGKTEVALRAAFKAVNAGFQVAILVPTTVLALQHYHSFRSRFGPFPVQVEMLSRLRSRKQQKRITEGINSGEIDIVIGTHRMLQRDINFKRLGLLIIDEEQRFGVAHKEMLKRARTDVHVMTMTATPIPRTLHMALAGIRDMSVINTPPRDRTPIRTFVTASSDMLIREAILRELNRGGQVYFVHNRVQSIHHVLNRLQKLVPEAKFEVGHGQMNEGELEEVMLRFVQHEFDVLVCTTIIESGVDIPNANTLIVDQANRFGLTQLYQLRGRVGRSHHRAYAYMLYDQNRPLSTEALARLEAIQEATELGAGFQIALRDLEIRGAGNILGAEQSGHITSVGFDLYTRMLAMAVEEIKQGRPIEEPEAVSVDLPIDAVIPEEYTGSEEIRIDLYRKIAAVRSLGALRDLQEEMIDRFGPMPDQVQRLVDVARLRIRASDLGITSIVERSGEVYIRPVLGSRLNQQVLRRELGPGVNVTPNQIRLSASRLSTDVWTAVQAVIRAVEDTDATVLAAAG